MKDFLIFQDGGTRRRTLVVRWTNRSTFSPHDSRPTCSPHYSHASDVSSPRLSSLVSSSARREPSPRRVRRVRLLRARLSSRGEVKERLRERGLTERVPLDDLSRGGVERGAQPGEFRQTHRREFVPTFPRAVPLPRRPRGGGRRGRHQRVRRLRVFARRGVRTRVASVAPITSELYLERVRRAVTRLEFPRRADVNHATVRHRNDAGRERLRLVHRVRRRQHGAAATRVVHQSTPHATTRGRVDRARGRVENQHRGVAHRRGRERDAPSRRSVQRAKGRLRERRRRFAVR